MATRSLTRHQKWKAAGGVAAMAAGVAGLLTASAINDPTVLTAAATVPSVGRVESCVLDALSGCTINHGFGEKPASITAPPSGASGPATLVIDPANTNATRWRASFWTHDGKRFAAGTSMTFYVHYDFAPQPTQPPTTAPTLTPTRPTGTPNTPPTTPTPEPTDTPDTTEPTPTQTATPTPSPTDSPTVTPNPPSPTASPEPLRPSWQTTGTPVLTFSDEFNDTVVDRKKWERGWFGDAISGPPNSNVENCYDSKQVTESGGHLHLAAAARTATCTIKGKQVTKPYVSGMVSTRLSFAQQHGAYEARFCNPDTNRDAKVDNWSAWWLNGPWSVTWPDHGEIDIMEGLNGGSKTSVHYADKAGAATHGGNYTSTPAVGCHNMGVQWTADKATFYYDGVRVWSSAFNGPYPMWLVLNYQLIADQPVHVGSEVTVDWVRVWK